MASIVYHIIDFLETGSVFIFSFLTPLDKSILIDYTLCTRVHYFIEMLQVLRTRVHTLIDPVMLNV